MRDFAWRGLVPLVTAVLSTWSLARPAAAQAPVPSAQPPLAQPPLTQPPPTQPVPVAAQSAPQAPPAGYQYPPPPPGYPYQYPPPPGYPYPPYVYQRRPPESVPYTGGPIPAGYHYEERPRKGLIISGALLTGVPWAIGLAGVSSANFPNHSGWLVLPVLGPWLTLAMRHDRSCSQYDDVCFEDGLNALARTALVFDGLVQTAGGVLFIVGISSSAKVMARDFTSRLHFTPGRLGRQGYGGFVTGEF